MGRRICNENHLEEIAEIVGEHVRLRGYDPDEKVSEKEIVYYADKRVNDDVIVSLEERLKYLLRRYGRGKADLQHLINENFNLSKRVEKKLFAKLDFRPEALTRMVDRQR